MTSEEIHSKTIAIADRYGDRNPQQTRQMLTALSKSDPKAVFEGLYKAFLSSEGDYFTRQKLAGKLLYESKPRLPIDLKEVIYGCLDTYNLSVDELPRYLCELCGMEEMLTTIRELRNAKLSERQAESLAVFHWWLAGPAQGTNG